MTFYRGSRGGLIAIVTVLAGCAAKTGGQAVSQPPGAPAVPYTRHTHENLNAGLWMQTAAEYRGTALQAYRLWQIHHEAAVSGPEKSGEGTLLRVAAGLPPATFLGPDKKT